MAERRDRQQQGRKRPGQSGPIRKRGCFFCKEKVDEISRVLKITDGVMRHMATKRLKNPARSGPPPRDPEPEPELTASPE